MSNGKTLVANAITAKGVSTSTSADFATMANNIEKITTYGFKVAPTIEWNAGKSINCSVGDTVYVISLYVATITGATKVASQNLMVNSTEIGGAYYEYKATATTVNVSFSYSANWLYFVV